MVDDRDREELIAMSRLLMAHDLTYVMCDLINAGRRHSQQQRGATTMLARAAVAFTIQLAIEEGQDPDQLRALECSLMASLRPKDSSAP